MTKIKLLSLIYHNKQIENTQENDLLALLKTGLIEKKEDKYIVPNENLEFVKTIIPKQKFTLIEKIQNYINDKIC